MNSANGYLKTIRKSNPTIYRKIEDAYQKHRHEPSNFRIALRHLPIPAGFHEDNTSFHIFCETMGSHNNATSRATKLYVKHNAWYQRNFPESVNSVQ